MNCLIIDDDAQFCQMIRQDFEGELTCRAATSKDIARHEIGDKSNHFDLILLDLYFPERFDGLDLLYLLREKRSGVPIIIVTKETVTPQNIVYFMQLGTNNFLSKTDYSIRDWRTYFKEAVEASQRHILLAFDTIDTPFAGWISAILTVQNWHVIRQCADYRLANLNESVKNVQHIVPILTPESIKSTWFKQLSDIIVDTNAVDKVIPILYRPCTTKLLQYDPVKLVSFCDGFNAFFMGKDLLINRIVEA